MEMLASANNAYHGSRARSPGETPAGGAPLEMNRPRTPIFIRRLVSVISASIVSPGLLVGSRPTTRSRSGYRLVIVPAHSLYASIAGQAESISSLAACSDVLA